MMVPAPLTVMISGLIMCMLLFVMQYNIDVFYTVGLIIVCFSFCYPGYIHAMLHSC